MQRHQILVIGVGSIGERHLRCFQATGRADVAFVEVNETLRRSVADRYAVNAFADLDSALAVPSHAGAWERGTFDAAVVATPAPLHVPMATRLAEAGVHLLIEKPLGTSLEGVDTLRRLVRERRLVAGVAYIYREYPPLVGMRQAVQAGRFGKPVELVAVCGQHFPTYRPAYRTIYYTNQATGGGAIQDALTHLVNAGEWLIGPVDRLAADAAHQVLEGVEVEDTVHLLTRHGSALGCYALNQHQAPNEITITVICERGSARCELHENRWRWMDRPGGPWHDEPTGPLERDAVFIAQANTFLDAVEGRGGPGCSLAEGIQTLRVNLAALKSAADGTWEWPEAMR